MATRDTRDQNSRKKSDHWFNREADGSVRLRIRLSPEEATLIEEGAGQTPLMLYIHRVLKDRANYHIRKRAEEEARLGKSVDNLPDIEDDVEDGNGTS